MLKKTFREQGTCWSDNNVAGFVRDQQINWDFFYSSTSLKNQFTDTCD
jgi:hypothetical protein